MKRITRVASIFVSIIALAGCGSSSSNPPADDADSDASTGDMSANGSLSMRLASKQISFSSGRSRIVRYGYDDTGNLSSMSFDNTTHSYTTNAQGQFISRDISFGGPPTTPVDAYYYDPVGGLRRSDITNASGVRGIELYKFDGDLATSFELRLFDVEVDPDQVDENTGRFLKKSEYQYENNQLVRELIDDDGDGVVDKQLDYSYNPDGTVSTALETGSSPSSFVYVYERGDCNNNWGNSTHDYFCVVDNP